MSKIDFSLNVRVEVIDDYLAKAYVNDVYVGRVKNGKKISFRHAKNPYSNTVPQFDNSDGLPMSALVANELLMRNLTPIVIRNYLRNFGFLNEKLPEFDYDNLQRLDMSRYDDARRRPAAPVLDYDDEELSREELFAKLQSLAA